MGGRAGSRPGSRVPFFRKESHQRSAPRRRRSDPAEPGRTALRCSRLGGEPTNSSPQGDSDKWARPPRGGGNPQAAVLLDAFNGGTRFVSLRFALKRRLRRPLCPRRTRRNQASRFVAPGAPIGLHVSRCRAVDVRTVALNAAQETLRSSGPPAPHRPVTAHRPCTAGRQSAFLRSRPSDRRHPPVQLACASLRMPPFR